MTTPVISVRDLRCRYGQHEAVRGIDFEVQAGELFALLGTNGAGKTTTMETVEGHREPSSGVVRVFGRDPWQDRSIRRRTGIMLQEGGFAGDLTVLETARLGGALTTRPSDVDGTLAAVGLAGRRDVRVRQLSGGERRRLDLALALLGEPDLLFLDEPTTGMDPESRRATWDLVRGLLARGTTVLLTTHYLEEAERLAHRLAIMHEGRIAVSGRLVDVLAAHRARIGFDVQRGTALPPLVGTAEVTGTRVEVRTPDLQRDLHTLLTWADGRVELRGLRAHHATLEDVFRGVREEVLVA
ncbi:ABC transporter ATP-binding protein [Saccharopolyspora hordei]|uniref:ABC-2 type transport system ATP-binding protein n=1 Tax=Saccharopolyspora hordei TaxID=1838 RepID=A0A853ANA4_9PSEU|nr:ABC transporter ATP-binding protein [Saccharopolyspora hordei]NYI81421.1 ABC-2 type transport system ATP-binding protein [Saccharopolyspora hordei]